jgi:hypothetical protein
MTDHAFAAPPDTTPPPEEPLAADAVVPSDGPPPRRRRDRLALPLTVALALAVVPLIAWSMGAFAQEDAPGPLVGRADPLLPDLAMGPIEDIAVGTTENGDQRLRFAASIVNIGEGPFLLRGRRPWLGNEDWSVEQWLQERDGGGYSSELTDATLIYGGDGHNHWHVKQVEVHQIETLDGEVLGRLVKQGFCFFDTDIYRASLPGTPEHGHWGARGCAGSFDTRVRMGLSVGWSDKYPWHLLDERIDITGLPDGQYRIREIADPKDQFEESNETNNETWVVVELTSKGQGLRETKVIEEGPAP